ncbi:hypothetical protein BGX28_008044 [Mortierella sp. GBA30]|nr:hypothetical protein BGX28_008044 [Mortierella sp. GBA30]
MTAHVADPPTANGAEPRSPSEVGMVFAHEYYTFLNKDPSRLHLFYNKNSILSHGYQGEDAIRDKIVQLDFEDCKVLLRNLDCQSSLNGGIVIQVLGEMSNRGGPAQKFVQTFFLAEQPKGFYVLNDIFRYLKDDTEEDYEEATTEESVPENSTEQPAHLAETKTEAAAAPVEQAPVPEPVVIEEKKPAVKADVQEVKPVSVPIAPPAANIVDEKKTSDKKADKKSEKKHETKDIKKADAKKEAEPVEKLNVAEPVKNAEASAASVAASVAVTVEPVPVPTHAPAAAAPAAPSKPKTWANLAANNSNQWGAQASATKGASVAVAPASPKPQTKPSAPGQPQQTQGQGHQAKAHGTRPSGREEYHSIYIKNVTERMSLDMLRESFSKFGKVTHLEYTHKRNCAFLDFSTPDAMNAALKQNTVPVGNEVVLAEERRRGGGNTFTGNANMPQNAGRPQSNVNGHGQQQQSQGGYRGGRASSSAARGGPGGPSDRTKQGHNKPEKAGQPVTVK